MGFIRGGLLVLVSVTLFILLLAGNLFLTISLSLDYEIIQPKLVPIITNTLNEQIELNSLVASTLPAMQAYCLNNSEYVFNSEQYVFRIPCLTVAQGNDAVLDYAVRSVVYEVYNGNFELIQGFELVSKYLQKQWWQSRLYFLFVVELILMGLIFLLAERKSNAFIIIGVLVIISSLFFVKLEIFVNAIINPIIQFFINISSPVVVDILTQVIPLLFSQSYFVFLLTFVIGIVFLILGILLKFFGLGFKINRFFSKFSKENSDENVSELSQKVEKLEKENKNLFRKINQKKEKNDKSKK